MSSPRYDMDCLAKKRRTLSCATGLRNLGPSVRRSLLRCAGGASEEGVEMAGDDYAGGGLPVEVDDCAGAGLPVEVGDCAGDGLHIEVDGCSDVDGDGEGDDTNGYDGPCLPDHPPRKFLPSQRQAMTVPPEDRADFEDCFHAFATGEGEPSCPPSGIVCNTRAAWIAGAYGCERALQLHCAADMFPSSGIMSCFLSEMYVLDVILNRSPLTDLPVEPGGSLRNKAALSGDLVDDDHVLLVRSYHEDGLDEANDYKFRTMILFFPQCGVFYCARECRSEEVGVSKTLIALDMSWLRLVRMTDSNGNVSYTFGDGGYVKRFHEERLDRVSGWRLPLNPTKASQQNLVAYRVVQCRDSEGPKLAPDVFDGHWQPNVPQEYLAVEYNRKLAAANSARKDGRHYAPGCHHYRLPDTCWIIDPTSQHFVDIMVDLPDLGHQKNRQSVVMVRNVKFLSDDDGGDFAGAMARITEHNQALRLARSSGQARQNVGDVGTMHALGTRVHLNGVTTGAYKANDGVEEDLLRDMVVSLARIGRCAFPQVYAVIRDTEGNSGLQPVVPMDGRAGHRVGYTVDMSVDLGNASHYNFNVGSQGFSLWGEDYPGMGKNWYLVMPNIHGVRPRGHQWNPFSGLAIMITDGVSISWDGRDIRHCTSVSQPDGSSVEGIGNKMVTKNHLYGSFTLAKERVVEAGRKVSAVKSRVRAEHTAPLSAGIAGGEFDKSASPILSGKRNRRKPRKNKKRARRKGARHPFDDDGSTDVEC